MRKQPVYPGSETVAVGKTQMLQIVCLTHCFCSSNTSVSKVRSGPSRATARPGPRETFSRGPKHFHGASLGRNFLNFFQNGTFWRTIYFWPTAGPPNVAGPGVAYPYPTLSTGLGTIYRGKNKIVNLWGVRRPFQPPPPKWHPASRLKRVHFGHKFW